MGKDQELLEAARSGNVTVVEKILGQRAKRSGPLARWVSPYQTFAFPPSRPSFCRSVSLLTRHRLSETGSEAPIVRDTYTFSVTSPSDRCHVPFESSPADDFCPDDIAARAGLSTVLPDCFLSSRPAVPRSRC